MKYTYAEMLSDTRKAAADLNFTLKAQGRGLYKIVKRGTDDTVHHSMSLSSAYMTLQNHGLCKDETPLQLAQINKLASEYGFTVVGNAELISVLGKDGKALEGMDKVSLAICYSNFNLYDDKQHYEFMMQLEDSGF